MFSGSNVIEGNIGIAAKCSGALNDRCARNTLHLAAMNGRSETVQRLTVVVCNGLVIELRSQRLVSTA